jgi:signal transduction histidine kinase
MSARRASIRMRTTAVAVVAVGVALLVTAVASVAFLRHSLESQIHDAAETRAASIASARRSDPQTVIAGDADEEFVQVVDAEGEIVASSPNAVDEPLIAHLRPGQERTVDDVPVGEDAPFWVVARGAGGETIYVGRSLEDPTIGAEQLTIAFAVALSIVLAVVAFVTWRIVGRALAPVEAIREEVDTISVGELDRRVPDAGADDEIGRLASTMNRMLERLEAGRDRERRFVSDASHELRSPVTSIRAHAELALRHPDRTDLPTLAGVAHEEALRLQRIVEDLLLLARIDEGTVQPRREPVDLDDLVHEEAARLTAMSSQRVVAERVEGLRLEADRGQLERVLRNLGENATRHARSTIALELRRGNGAAVLAVEDDGEGIADGDRERVFDRFVRLDEARERDRGGSGLGLAIVREIATLHGGSVAVTDGSLGGARFEVRLPAS